MTRDILDLSLDIREHPVLVADTADWRETADEGSRLGLRGREKCAFLLFHLHRSSLRS
jgi:tRNA U34 5-carboxymethylaminomethyl modifying GTPase MnmE/TrmE